MITEKDFPQLTAVGSYGIDIPFNRVPGQIEDWVKREKPSLNMNPDFQRGHVWTPEQKVLFIEYLLSGGKTSMLLFNCPGWMYTWKGPFEIVDGKQRIHAIVEFFKGKFKAHGYFFHEFAPYIIGDITRRRVRFNINNLQTRAEVLKWYLELNSGGTPHTKEELDKVKSLLEKEKE